MGVDDGYDAGRESPLPLRGVGPGRLRPVDGGDPAVAVAHQKGGPLDVAAAVVPLGQESG
ncbi:MAG: hypothetical protein JWN02_1350, partial [Acidobacteria bacterium]|nr:hypothetical protein [Acidobacteriota bacterium]